VGACQSLTRSDLAAQKLGGAKGEQLESAAAHCDYNRHGVGFAGALDCPKRDHQGERHRQRYTKLREQCKLPGDYPPAGK
jgi:hypothetical protein